MVWAAIGINDLDTTRFHVGRPPDRSHPESIVTDSAPIGTIRKTPIDGQRRRTWI